MGWLAAFATGIAQGAGFDFMIAVGALVALHAYRTFVETPKKRPRSIFDTLFPRRRP